MRSFARRSVPWLVGAVLVAAACGPSMNGTSSAASSSSGGTGGKGSSHAVSSALSTGAAGTGGGGPDLWSCIGSVKYPAPVAAKVNFPTTLDDAINNNAAVMVTVATCDKADTACATPLAQGMTDAKGQVALTAPSPPPDGFEGFFRATGNGWVSSDYFFAPFGKDTSVVANMVTPGDVNIIANFASIVPDPTRGTVVLYARSCLGGVTSAEGVTFAVDTADASSKVIYFKNGMPDPTATETDSAGAIALVANLPAGSFKATGTVKALGKAYGTMAAHVAAAEIAFMFLGPTP